MNAQPNGTFLLHDFLLKSDLILKKDERRTILFTFFNLQQCIKFSVNSSKVQFRPRWLQNNECKSQGKSKSQGQKLRRFGICAKCNIKWSQCTFNLLSVSSPWNCIELNWFKELWQWYSLQPLLDSKLLTIETIWSSLQISVNIIKSLLNFICKTLKFNFKYLHTHSLKTLSEVHKLCYNFFYFTCNFGLWPVEVEFAHGYMYRCMWSF